ncbi:MAG TPA: hypothetical protein ENN63_12465 [Bacteroidetes bacterium]|nr:hypothetical protein [Bacteroidota bacterium]
MARFALKEMNPAVRFAGMLGLALLIYSIIRAASLSITHDEALTFLRHVPESWNELLYFHTCSANNHWLNTVLVKLLIPLTGPGEWALRIPSLAGHAIYLCFSYLFAAQVKNPWWQAAVFSMFVLQPFPTEFFSLSRGYGLMMGTGLGSLWFFVQFYRSALLRDLFASLFLSAAAVLSSFTWWYVLIMQLVILASCFLTGFHGDRTKKLCFVAIWMAGLLVAGLVGNILLNMNRQQELYLTPGQGFWSGTLKSLINSQTTYFGTGDIRILAGMSIFILLAGLTARQLWKIRHKKKAIIKDPLFILSLILGGVILIHTLVFHITRTISFMHRTALFYIPLFNAVATFLIASQKPGILKLTWIPAVLLILQMVFFLPSVNLSHTSHWKADADVKRMIRTLEKTAGEYKRLKVDLGISWLHEPAINYYRVSWHHTWLRPVHREGIGPNQDFYFLPDTVQVPTGTCVDTVEIYPVSSCVLLRNRNIFTSLGTLSEPSHNRAGQ